MQGAKTPPEKVDTIKSLLRQGYSRKVVAQKVGVSLGVVSNISASMNAGKTIPRLDLWFPVFKIKWEDMRRLFGK